MNHTGFIIETENLRKQYRQKTAVENVSIRVAPGQIYGFLGPNGAGKSTFIKMLTGLVRPTSGTAAVLGRPPGDIRARERMGYLPELFRYQEWMTGEDLLNFHTGLYRLKKDPARNRRILARVGLLGQEKYKVGAYSKGMQQRIGLGCALISEPELLFLDEPTSALDPIGRKEVRDIIQSFKSDGTTVFLNSHLLSEVEAVSDSVTIIHRVTVVKSGRLDELLAKKTELTVRAANITEETLQRIDKTLNVQSTLRPDGRVYIELIENESAVPKIAALLVNSGADLYEMTVRHETLESVFLQAVGEGEPA
jgi:ABC-2 type transport system ATP-binding protein